MSTTWNTTVRPWVEAGKMFAPQAPLFGGDSRRRIVAISALGAAAMAVAGTGTAFAYWRTTGLGSAGSSIGASGYSSTVLGNVKTTSATTSSLLRPSGTGDVAVKITNSNTFNIRVTSVDLTATGATGCSTPALTAVAPTGYTVNGSAVTLPLTITAGSTTTIVEAGALQMGASSNDCQNKTIDVPASINWTG